MLLFSVHAACEFFVTRRKFSSEEKIRIVLEGLRGEETIQFASVGHMKLTVPEVVLPHVEDLVRRSSLP